MIALTDIVTLIEFPVSTFSSTLSYPIELNIKVSFVAAVILKSPFASETVEVDLPFTSTVTLGKDCRSVFAIWPVIVRSCAKDQTANRKINTELNITFSK